MKKLLTIIALIGTVCLMSATTSTADVEKLTTNASGDYGFQGCQCYHACSTGPAFCAVPVATSECTSRGIPKPAGCR